MAISQLPQAPFRQDRRLFPTPLIGDVLFSEIRDCTRIQIPEYGTPHPDTNKWPDHKLIYVKPVDIERNEIFEFFYAAERQNQDLYNFSSSYRNIIGNVGGREFRIVQRTYVTLRESFQPLDIPFGTAMPDVPQGKFDGVEYVFFDRQQQPIQEETLNSLYVAEVHTYIETAFLEYKLSYGTQKSEVVPEKFRALIPQTSTEQIVEGLAEQPTLTGSELSVTQDQINPDIKLVRATSRADQQTGYSLSGKQVTNVLQIADVVETIVPDGATITASALTVDGSVEPLGNGQSIQRVITAPELFAAETFAAEKPDVVPEKFRVAIPTTTTEERIEGTAEEPTLEVGDLTAVEQQENQFVKSVKKTRRDATNLPVELTQKATSNVKQIATVTETLQNGDTTESPSATVDIESQALGDGTYVVRKVEVPELFEAKAFSVRRPDVVPEKFRSALPIETETTDIAGIAAKPTLAVGELERSAQQSNEFVYREQVTRRELTSDISLTGKRAYVEGGPPANVIETYSNGDIEVDTGVFVVQSTVTPLGDGSSVKETVEVESWPVLTGSEFDFVLNTQVVNTQQMVEPPTDFSEPNTSFRPINEDRSLKVVEEVPVDALGGYHISVPTRIDLRLPAVLKSISVLWVTDESVGEGESVGSGTEPEGAKGYSITAKAEMDGKAEFSARPTVNIETETVFGSDISATVHFFYLNSEGLPVSENALLSRINTLTGDVSIWPLFKPKSHTIVANGASVSCSSQAKLSATILKTYEEKKVSSQSATEGGSSGVNRSIDVINVAPTIHGPITVANGSQVTSVQTISQARARLEGDAFDDINPVITTKGASASVSVTPLSFPATNPQDIPRTGKYLVGSSAEPFKWGWLKCSATIIDASQFAS